MHTFNLHMQECMDSRPVYNINVFTLLIFSLLNAQLNSTFFFQHYGEAFNPHDEETTAILEVVFTTAEDTVGGEVAFPGLNTVGGVGMLLPGGIVIIGKVRKGYVKRFSFYVSLICVFSRLPSPSH